MLYRTRVPRSCKRRYLVLVAIGLGISLSLLFVPLQWSAGFILVTIACGAALLQPDLGLAIAVLVGPGKALAWATLPGLPAEPGQVFVALTIAGWLLRGLYERRLYLTLGPVSTSLLLYVVVGALSLWDATDPIEGLKELLKWLQVIGVSVMVVDISQRGRLSWLVAAALLAGMLQAGIGLWQFEIRGTGPPSFEVTEGRYRAYGTFEQPNPFGGFMGLIWPLAVAVAISGVGPSGLKSITRNRLAALAVAVVTIMALLASYSRGAWVGALAASGMMVIFWPRRRWIGIAFAGFVLATMLFLAHRGWLPSGAAERLGSLTDIARVSDVRGVHITSSNFSLIERFAHWQAAMSMAQAHPWLGVGIGNFEAAYPDFRLSNWQYGLGHAHNAYLNVAAETGMIGLASYLFFWGVVFASTMKILATNRAWERAIALGLLGVWTHLSVHHLVDNLLVNNVHVYIGILLGMQVVVAARISREDLVQFASKHSNQKIR